MSDNADVYRDPVVVASYGVSDHVDAAEPLALAAFAAALPAGPVLDVGVGGGRTTGFLRDLGDGYHGVDYSAEMVDLARRQHPGVTFSVQDARALDLPDASFAGVVFSYNGIDSVGHDDRAQVFRSVRRVLLPGGAFLYSTLNKDGGNYRARPWRELHAESTGARMRLLVRRAKVARNWWAVRGREVDHPAWGMSTLAAHDFRLLNHFVTVRGAFAEAREHGFDVVQAWANDGAPLEPSAGSGSAYVYLLLRAV